MKKIKQFAVLLFGLVVTGSAWAYGSGSGGAMTCKKPKFSDFSPPHLAEVSPMSEFSFTASAATLPGTINVSVKKEKVDVTVTEERNQFRVTGLLPESLKGTYARITVNAMGPNNCKGEDGWLVKIADQ